MMNFVVCTLNRIKTSMHATFWRLVPCSILPPTHDQAGDNHKMFTVHWIYCIYISNKIKLKAKSFDVGEQFFFSLKHQNSVVEDMYNLGLRMP